MYADTADPGFVATAVEAPVEIPWITVCPNRSSEHKVIRPYAARGKPDRLPPLPRCFLLGTLLHTPQFQCRQANIRKRQNTAGLVIVCLCALLVNELSPDTLELPAHIDFACTGIDPGSRESEYLALAEPKHEREHIRGVERIAVIAGGLQEPARFLDTPGRSLAAALRRGRYLHQGCDVTRHDLVYHGLAERRPEGITHCLYRALPGIAFTALPGRAASAFAFRAPSVLPLCAALTCGSKVVQPCLHLADS